MLIIEFLIYAQFPSYLAPYMKEYKRNPRAANLHWFKNAGFGMFIHYGTAEYWSFARWLNTSRRY